MWYVWFKLQKICHLIMCDYYFCGILRKFTGVMSSVLRTGNMTLDFPCTGNQYFHSQCIHMKCYLIWNCAWIVGDEFFILYSFLISPLKWLLMLLRVKGIFQHYSFEGYVYICFHWYAYFFIVDMILFYSGQDGCCQGYIFNSTFGNCTGKYKSSKK